MASNVFYRTLLCCLYIVTVARRVVDGFQVESSDDRKFVWPEQWSGVQEISIVSGNFSGALQRGLIAYDFVNGRTREDQVLLNGPSVRTPETSNNMTEWFNGTHWFYMNWEKGECEAADFGIGMVLPDWLLNDASFPRNRGVTYIHAYVPKSGTSLDAFAESLPPRSDFKRQFVNTSWIWVDGSAGFGEPAGSSLFEWYVDSHLNGKRLHMPSTLSADLVVDIQGFKREVTSSWFDIPEACIRAAAASDATPIHSLGRLGVVSSLSSLAPRGLFSRLAIGASATKRTGH